MFQWLYHQIATNVIKEIKPEIEQALKEIDINSLISKIDLKEIVIKTLQDETVQDEITEFTDALYDRYKTKVLNTLATSERIIGKETGITSIVNSKGGINLKGIIGSLIKGYLEKGQQNQPQSSSTF